MGRNHKALPQSLVNRPHFVRLRNIWHNILHRTMNPHNTKFQRYGARNIKVCERWLDFENFYADMKDGYQPGLSVQRMDNDGDYCPENCRWATKKEQANNRRSNRLITIDGVTMTLTQWIEHKGLKGQIVRNRIYMYKWPVEKALSPIKERKVAQ